MFKKLQNITIFYNKIFKIFIFYIKIIRNTNFYIDTRLLWGNSCEEMFGNVSRLLRFGVYFEITLNRK